MSIERKKVLTIVPNKYRALGDKYCYTLQVYNEGGYQVKVPGKGGVTKTKEPCWEDAPAPYHSRIDLLVKEVLSMQVLSGPEEESLLDALNRVNEFTKSISL